MISREVADKFAGLVRNALEERFKDDLTFESIVVEPFIGHYGDEYLDTFVVYRGEYKKLDPGWTITLPRLLEPEMARLGVSTVPIFSYVPKNEWEEVFHSEHPRANES